MWCTGGGQSCPSPQPLPSYLPQVSWVSVSPSPSHMCCMHGHVSALLGDTALPFSRAGFFFALVDILKCMKDPPPLPPCGISDKTGPPLSGPSAPSCLPRITDIEHCSMLTREETLCPPCMLAQVPATTQQGGGHREILSSRVLSFQGRSTCPAGTGDKMNSEGRKQLKKQHNLIPEATRERTDRTQS